MKIEHKRLDGTSYYVSFEPIDLFCPNCGKKSLWGDGSDDYYAGCGLHCASCGYVIHSTYEGQDEHEVTVKLASGPARDIV